MHTAEAAWESLPDKHRKQTSSEELTSARALDPAEQTSQEEKLTSTNRWQTSREELISVAKKPSRATVGICTAQTKGMESVSRHRRREVDISEAPTRGIRLKSRHLKQRVGISIFFQLPSICLQSAINFIKYVNCFGYTKCNPAAVPVSVPLVLALC